MPRRLQTDVLSIERRATDIASVVELRGLIAHELGHLADPLLWRPLRMWGVSSVILIVLLIVAEVLSNAWSTELLAAAGLAVLVWWGRESKRTEYRADALGARIASPEEIAASFQLLERNWRTRWLNNSRLLLFTTHPRLKQRRAALAGRPNRQARAALRELARAEGYEP